MQRFENVTLYFSGESFGNYHRILCKYVEIEIKPWAQYPSAVHFRYLEKGKRKLRGFVQSYRPSLIVAEGHNTPKPASMFGDEMPAGEGVTIARARHSSCGAGWRDDFNRDIKPQLTILADFDGHNSHQRQFAGLAS